MVSFTTSLERLRAALGQLLHEKANFLTKVNFLNLPIRKWYLPPSAADQLLESLMAALSRCH